MKIQASTEWYDNKMVAYPADISDVIHAENGWMIPHLQTESTNILDLIVR